MLANKTILVTGGTGSFGKTFIATVLKNYPTIKEVVVFSRDPQKQAELSRQFCNAPLRFITGDLSDAAAVTGACHGVDLIIHTAAMRLVTEAENDPWEAIQTNILGARNLIDGALKNQVRQILALSTDMASLANNAYGATKMLSDKLFIDANHRYPNLQTVIIRYGNMLGSKGTVIPFFIRKAKEDGILPITNPQMTRFMATLDDCVKIALRAIETCLGGEIIAPKFKSYKITTIAQAVDEKAKIQIIGLRPGEKLFEEMITRYDSFYAIEASECYIIVPSYADKTVYCQHYSAIPVPPGFEFNSENNSNKYTLSEMQEIIREWK